MDTVEPLLAVAAVAAVALVVLAAGTAVALWGRGPLSAASGRRTAKARAPPQGADEGAPSQA